MDSSAVITASQLTQIGEMIKATITEVAPVGISGFALLLKECSYYSWY